MEKLRREADEATRRRQSAEEKNAEELTTLRLLRTESEREVDPRPGIEFDKLTKDVGEWGRKAEEAQFKTQQLLHLLERVRMLPTPYTLHPTPFTLHPTPYTLHPTPYTLHPTPTPYTLHPTPGI